MNRFDDFDDRIPPTYTGIGGTRPPRNYNHQQPPKWRAFFFFIGGLIAVLLLLWAYLFFLLQPYTPFTANNEVAQVTVHLSREGLDQLSVQVIHIDANGYQKVDKPYLIQGNKVVLEYEYVTMLEGLGLFGLHSGYILIGLEGYYNDGTIGTYKSLGTADQNQWPLVSPHFSSITFTVDGKAHPLMMSQTGIQEH